MANGPTNGIDSTGLRTKEIQGEGLLTYSSEKLTRVVLLNIKPEGEEELTTKGIRAVKQADKSKNAVFKIDDYDKEAKMFQFSGTSFMAEPKDFRLAYGAELTASFQANGKEPTEDDEGYYWVQYYMVWQQFERNGKTLNTDNPSQTWYVDGKNLGLDKMPNAIQQEFIGSHPFKDFAHIPFPIGRRKGRSYVSDDGSFVKFRMTSSPEGHEALITRSLANFHHEVVAKYQLYLMKVGKKAPLGYISWGYDFNATKKGLSVNLLRARWYPGKDPEVFGVAKYKD